jgi:hypothetical protein
MSITITLPPDKEKELHERATAAGLDVGSFVQRVIEETLRARPTLDEILAPFRREVEESGMTDDELESFFREARDEVRAERKAKQGKTP